MRKWTQHTKSRFVRARVIQRKQDVPFLEAWMYAWQAYPPPIGRKAIHGRTRKA